MEIKFNKVSFFYNENNYILKDLDLTIKEGKITSIIGKSGSGKTTLAELMNALILPKNGNITIGSYSISSNGLNSGKEKSNLRKNIGLVFQFPEEQFFNLTVKEEVSFGIKYYKYKVSEIEKRVIDALKMVGLDESYLDRNPFTLSSGEKRKVALASVLVLNPKIVILDEPTIGLDSASKKSLLQLIRKLKTRYNKTIVLISHDMEFVHTITDYVIAFEDGNIILEGDKYKVFKQEEKLNEHGIRVPKTIEFSNKVLNKKGIKIGYRDQINDLIKDIYRYVK